MSTIHIRIGHNHNLVVTKFSDIKVISIAFGKSASKCIDHSLDFCVCKHLVNGGFLHIQDLTADRKDCLVITISGSLCRATSGISLYDKDFTK